MQPERPAAQAKADALPSAETAKQPVRVENCRTAAASRPAVQPDTAKNPTVSASKKPIQDKLDTPRPVVNDAAARKGKLPLDKPCGKKPAQGKAASPAQGKIGSASKTDSAQDGGGGK